MTASSSLDEHDQSFNGRLVRESIDQSDIRGCWCARDVNLRQYIEADLGEVKTVTGYQSTILDSHLLGQSFFPDKIRKVKISIKLSLNFVILLK